GVVGTVDDAHPAGGELLQQRVSPNGASRLKIAGVRLRRDNVRKSRFSSGGQQRAARRTIIRDKRPLHEGTSLFMRSKEGRNLVLKVVVPGACFSYERTPCCRVAVQGSFKNPTDLFPTIHVTSHPHQSFGDTATPEPDTNPSSRCGSKDASRPPPLRSKDRQNIGAPQSAPVGHLFWRGNEAHRPDRAGLLFVRQGIAPRPPPIFGFPCRPGTERHAFGHGPRGSRASGGQRCRKNGLGLGRRGAETERAGGRSRGAGRLTEACGWLARARDSAAQGAAVARKFA